jgi:hypothetical protein
MITVYLAQHLTATLAQQLILLARFVNLDLEQPDQSAKLVLNRIV